MQNIIVGRYSKEAIDGVPGIGVYWQGWVEPADRSWIVFIRADGQPVVYLNRDSKTGAVLDQPVQYRGMEKRMKRPLDIGDVVRLRSGGPKMTIERIEKNKGVVCTWFLAGHIEGNLFEPAALKRVKK